MKRGLLWIFLTVPMLAQEQTTTIAGTVSGPQGVRLQAAVVEARRDNGLRLSTTTDQAGVYRIHSVPSGNYTIHASAPGFDPLRVVDVRIRLGEVRRVDMALNITPTNETLTVRAGVPLVDTGSSATQASFQSTEFMRLPHGRDFTSILVFAGAMNDEFIAGGISVNGASGGENHYVVDGVDVTDPRFGIAGKQVVVDAIEEVQMKTAGYEAEFGGATGGVVNAITRSGTNDLRGSLMTYRRHSAWNGAPRPVLKANILGSAFRLAVPLPTKTTISEPLVTLSGPLVRDRFWFFALANPTLRNTTRPATSSHEAFRSDNVVANFTGTPTQRISAKIAANIWRGTTRGTLADEGGTLAVNPTRYANLNQRDRNETYSGYVDVLPTARLLVSLRGGRYLTRQRLTGTPNEIMYEFEGSPDAFPEVPAELKRPRNWVSITTGTGNIAIDHDNYARDDVSLDAELTREGAGHHVLKAGVQVSGVTNDVRAGYQQPLYYFQWNSAPFVPYPGKYGALMIEMESEAGNATARAHALFLQDRWTLPGERVTLNVGVRAEEETVPSYADAARGLPRDAIRFGFRDKIAPRLGFSWDVAGDRTTKIYGSYGTYFDRTKMAVARTLFGGYRDFYYNFSLDTYDWLHLQCTGINQLPTDRPTCNGAATFTGLRDEWPIANDPQRNRVARDLKPMQSREWTLGAERQMNSSLRAGLHWIHRELVRAIEDVGIDPGTGRSLVLSNPGEGVARTVKAGLPPLPKPVRDYDGIEIEMSTPAGRRIAVHGSYLYSRLRGNYSGVLNSDDRVRYPPYLSKFGDTPANLYDAHAHAVYGPLATDRPHQVKLQAAYDLPTNTLIGMNQRLASGTPVSLELMFQNAPFFPNGRGSLGRTPRISQTDMFVAQRFTVGRLGAEINLNVLNVFDHKTPISIYPRYSQQNISVTEAQFFAGFDVAAVQSKLTKNAFFGKANVFQPPREIRVGAKINF
jgi:hypothetical protein